MVRRTFPDEGSRLVYAVGAADRLQGAPSELLKLYTDDAATTLADIQTPLGVAIPGSVVAVDENSLLSLFLGPDDGRDTLYAQAADGTGPVSVVYARTDDRLDALEAGGGVGGVGNTVFTNATTGAGLQAVINAAPAGTEVELTGTCVVAATVNLWGATAASPKVIRLRGGSLGSDASRGQLVADAALTGPLLSIAPSPASGQTAGFEVRDLYIDQSAAQTTAEGIYLDKVQQTRLDNVKIRGGKTGVKVGYANSNRFKDVWCFKQSDAGMRWITAYADASTVPEAVDHRVEGCLVYQTSGATTDTNAGIEILSGNDFQFLGGHILRSPGNGHTMTHGLRAAFASLKNLYLFMDTFEIDGVYDGTVTGSGGALTLVNVRDVNVVNSWLSAAPSDGKEWAAILDGSAKVRIGAGTKLNGRGVRLHNSPATTSFRDAIFEQSDGDPCFTIGTGTPTDFEADVRWYGGSFASDPDTAALQAHAPDKRYPPPGYALVVAAADASARVKAHAAYVCDGVEDEVQIIAACAEADALGSLEVVLSAGTFEIESGPIRHSSSGRMFWDNLTIRGQGVATRLHNALDLGGGDIYTFYVRGDAGTDDRVRGVTIKDLLIYGDEYLVNTKSQHGISVLYAEDVVFDNLRFETLSEEALVLDRVNHARIGRLYGKQLGSGVLDMGGCEDVTVDQVHGEQVTMVETASATVQVFDGATAGRICRRVNIGKITSKYPGGNGFKLSSGEDINIGQIAVLGSTVDPKTQYGVMIQKATTSDPPKHINIGQVTLRNTGARGGADPAFQVALATWVNVQQICVEGSYGQAVRIFDSSYVQIGQILAHDPTDIGQNPAPQAVLINNPSNWCSIDQVIVRGWNWSAANGGGVEIDGDFNTVGMVLVSGSPTVTGADSWDFNFGDNATLGWASENNILGALIGSGHGTGGYRDGGTGNQVGRVIQGVDGASYKPYANGGSATLLTGQTNVLVSHGLAWAPLVKNVRLTPTNQAAAEATWWIDSAGANTFRINIPSAAASDLTFEWAVSPI